MRTVRGWTAQAGAGTRRAVALPLCAPHITPKPGHTPSFPGPPKTNVPQPVTRRTSQATHRLVGTTYWAFCPPRTDRTGSYFSTERVGSARGYQGLSSSVPAWRSRLRRGGSQPDCIFMHRLRVGNYPLLPPTGSSGLPWCRHPVCRACCLGPATLGGEAGRRSRRGDEREPRQGRPDAAGRKDGFPDGRDVGRVHGDPGRSGPGTDAGAGSSSRTGVCNVVVERSCAVSVAGAQEGVVAQRVRSQSHCYAE